MNLGLRKMQISSAAVPPKRMRPIQRRSATAPARAPGLAPAPARRRVARQARCDALQAHARASPSRAPCRPARSSSASSSPAACASATVCASPAKRRRDLGRERADGDQQLDPARGRMLADLAVQRRRLRAQLEHVAEHRHAPRGRRGGEVVDRRAHGHRVGVVAVVDQRRPRRAARRRCAAHRREAAPPDAPRASSPSARAAATAASRLRRLCACAKEGRSSIPSPPCVDHDAAVCAALAQRDIAALAEAEHARDPRAGAPRAAARRAGTTDARARARAPRSARPSRPRSPRASRAARDARGRR